ELQEQVERVPLGSKQDITVTRDGKEQTLRIVAKALPKDFGVGSRDNGHRSQKSDTATFESDDLGLEVAELTAEQAETLGVAGNSGGVITKVSPDSVAGEQDFP